MSLPGSMFVPSEPTKPISVVVLPSTHCGSPGPPCRPHAPRVSPEGSLKAARFHPHFSAFSPLTVPSRPTASFRCAPFWTTSRVQPAHHVPSPSVCWSWALGSSGWSGPSPAGFLDTVSLACHLHWTSALQPGFWSGQSPPLME